MKRRGAIESRQGALGMADDVRHSAAHIAADVQDDLPQELTRPVWQTAPVARNCDARAEVAVQPRGRVRLLKDVTAIRRLSPSAEAQSEADHYVLQLLTAGSPQGDIAIGAMCADVGDICIVDPMQLCPPPVEAVSIAMSRPVLESAVGMRQLHGVVLKANAAMTPVIGSLLIALCSLVAPLPDMQAMAAQEAIITLLAAALKDHRTNDAALDASVLGAGLRQRIVEFITRNVQLLELSPEFLCHHFKVSRAHLYRAFASDGGVAKVLRNIRLDAAYRELTQPARSSRSITEIAYSLGFSSGNQLLRTFRSRFGVTPSEARTSEQG